MNASVRARVAAAAAAFLLAGCGVLSNAPPDDAPWKASGDGVVITAAPDAGGVLSFRNCPTLDEARAAIPAITAGPEANAVPFKTMVLQCGYALPGRDREGHAAGVSILVFDALADGRQTWEWTLDGDSGTPTVLPDLGPSAFATQGGGQWEVWVEGGRFGLHLMHTSPTDLALDEMAALARAALAGLERPPR